MGPSFRWDDGLRVISAQPISVSGSSIRSKLQIALHKLEGETLLVDLPNFTDHIHFLLRISECWGDVFLALGVWAWVPAFAGTTVEERWDHSDPGVRTTLKLATGFSIVIPA